MADWHPKGTHNPSQKSLQRWVSEGGAPKGGRSKRPRDFNQAAKLAVDIAIGRVERPGSTRQRPLKSRPARTRALPKKIK
jgi:hypothetical protein